MILLNHKIVSREIKTDSCSNLSEYEKEKQKRKYFFFLFLLNFERFQNSFRSSSIIKISYIRRSYDKMMPIAFSEDPADLRGENT